LLEGFDAGFGVFKGLCAPHLGRRLLFSPLRGAPARPPRARTRPGAPASAPASPVPPGSWRRRKKKIEEAREEVEGVSESESAAQETILSSRAHLFTCHKNKPRREKHRFTCPKKLPSKSMSASSSTKHSHELMRAPPSRLACSAANAGVVTWRPRNSAGKRHVCGYKVQDGASFHYQHT